MVAIVVTVFLLLRKQRAYPPLVYAPQGQLAAGFPKELILDSKAKLSASYAVGYDRNLNQYTANYSSDEPMLAIFSQYKDYFKNNGWTITNEVAQYKTSRGIYAKKDKNDVSVAIVDAKQSRQIIVSYLYLTK